MKTQAQDFTRYHDLRREMQSMIRSGKIHYLTFDDLFTEFVEITNRHGGLPPVPTDIDAADQELAEMGVEQGTR